MAGSGWRSQVRAGLEITPLGRTQSERRRRLALASGFRLLRSFGIDRLDAPAHAAERGSVGPDAEDLDDHRQIFDAGDDLQSAAAVRAVFDGSPLLFLDCLSAWVLSLFSSMILLYTI